MKTKSLLPIKETSVRIRVTKAQHEALMDAARQMNTTFSVYARKVLLRGIKINEETRV